MSDTYFKIYLHHESFDSVLRPEGLSELVDSCTFNHVMSMKSVLGVHHFTCGSFKIDLVVKSLKHSNNG